MIGSAEPGSGQRPAPTTEALAPAPKPAQQLAEGGIPPDLAAQVLAQDVMGRDKEPGVPATIQPTSSALEAPQAPRSTEVTTPAATADTQDASLSNPLTGVARVFGRIMARGMRNEGKEY